MSKVTVIALRRVGKYAVGDKIETGKYEARILVAMGKAKFEKDDDDFRRVQPTKRRRRTSAVTSTSNAATLPTP